ncbi:MAG: radical SAM protein [Acidaminobacteraceae bacterium]
MSSFSYKDIYIEAGKKVLEINVLPEKYCNFDCIFCPIGRSHNKVDMPQRFEDVEASMEILGRLLDSGVVDLVFINSMGEAFVNDKLLDIIYMIKSKGVAVRLLSNGYLLADEKYKIIANMCDEVIGEVKAITELDFQKLQRPIEGYTLEEHHFNMILFNEQYTGKFILEVTIIKGYNDSDYSVSKIKGLISMIAPDKVNIVTIDEEPFAKKLGITKERLSEISELLLDLQ